MGQQPNSCWPHGTLAQRQEAGDLKSLQAGFESQACYHGTVDQFGRSRKPEMLDSLGSNPSGAIYEFLKNFYEIP